MILEKKCSNNQQRDYYHKHRFDFNVKKKKNWYWYLHEGAPIPKWADRLLFRFPSVSVELNKNSKE